MSRRRSRQVQEIFTTPIERPVLTVAMSYVRLILAIREQAIEDGKLSEWEAFWIRSSEMRSIWRHIRITYKRRTHEETAATVQ